ncbi:8-amino-7-oxononanoate synthase [Massilia niabensis]|uniref:8-amino-7-oxononanoate synthase n=1 Tax=Massilia niabensis TaxID=544910 RepID=A0ABW0L2F8_9BURK
MDLIDSVNRKLAALDAQNLIRRRRVADTRCAPLQVVDGRAVLAFCSNDYLGLAAHPRVVAALREGAQLYGAGSGASHLISGHSRAHAILEERLADFAAPHIEDARALYLSTGYMANLAVLTALGADSDAAIFSEQLNHASLIDGARLAKAAVSVYPHGDLAALEAQLAASSAATKIVATDSVFSMDGDLAPLPGLLALCERHGAWLVVDDAHGFGVLGAQGRGALEHFGLRSPHLVYVGTLGKAAGVGGAFIAAHASVIELLVQRARPYIYTTAAPPALAHALLTSLDIITSEEGNALRAHLESLVTQLGVELQLQRWDRPASPTAIQPVLIGSNEEALRVAAGLYAKGLWVPAIRPPTVPQNTARLRVTLSGAHTHDEVARLAAALNELEGAS